MLPLLQLMFRLNHFGHLQILVPSLSTFMTKLKIVIVKREPINSMKFTIVKELLLMSLLQLETKELFSGRKPLISIPK